MSEFSRRELLRRGLVAAGAGLAAIGCDRVADPYALEKPRVPGVAGQRLGQESWVTTACDQCSLQCGIQVRVVEGRSVKIEGLRDDPVSRGGLGSRGQAGLEVAYHAARVRSPLKRSGPRGEGSLEPIGWEQAIEEVAAALAKLRRDGDAGRLVVLSGRERGMMNDLWARFCRAVGTPNLLQTASHGPAGPLGRAMEFAIGAADVPAYDLANAACMLSLGSGMLEGGALAGYAIRGLAEARQSHPGRRAKLTHVGPAFSLTASAADEWIPSRPGALAQVALAIGNVLAAEELFDRAFVAERTFGFEPWTEADGTAHEGYAGLLERHSPEAVAATTGIPAEVLVRIAHELGGLRPALVIVDERSTSGPDGLEVARAALALNALLGSIDRRGGVLIQRRAPIRPWPEVVAGDVPRARVDSGALARFPLAISVPEVLVGAGHPAPDYPPAAVFLDRTGPAFVLAPPGRVGEALRSAPLVVSFAPFLDASTALADYVLPDHVPLERWEDAETAPATGFPVFRVRRPAIVPVHETRQTGDVVLAIAKAMSGPVAAAAPWSDFRAAMLDRAAGIREAGRGSVTGEDDATFVERLLEKGSWVDPEYRYEQWAEVLRTPSGRFEFFSQQMMSRYRQAAAAGGGSVEAVLAGAGGPGSLDAACLGEPVPVVPAGDPALFPLVFLPYVALNQVPGGPEFGHLRELGEPLTGARWGAPAEINPRTAEAAGIGDGDLVAIESAVGSIKVRVSLFEGVPADAVRMAVGGGRPWDPGRPADGGDPGGILATGVTNALGRAAVASVRVRLNKVSS